MQRVLVAAEDSPERALISNSASRMGFQVTTASTSDEAIAQMAAGPVHLVVVDLDLMASGHLLESLPRDSASTRIAAYTRHPGHLDKFAGVSAVVLMRAPIDEGVVTNALKYLQWKLESFPIARREAWDAFLGVSSQADQVRNLLRKLAHVNHPILIRGETGVGKERVARALHAADSTRKGPLVIIDCGSISPSLIESELFGYEKGAFTGADTSHKGLLLEANKGTIFLDEIGDLPLASQASLLRVLQDKEVRPLGSTKRILVNFRVLAATNRNLLDMVANREFREDLYYRIAGVTVEVPSLRLRRADIPFIANDFMESILQRRPLSVAAHAALQAYDWPGNIRQLQNVLLRACALTDNDVITPTDLFELQPKGEGRAGATLDDLERKEILRVMSDSHDDKNVAAQRLGIGRTTLYRKLESYKAHSGD